jgi:dihydropteroate synthase
MSDALSEQRAAMRESMPRPRPRILGILNVTPDSFSDGGTHADAEEAIEHGLAMREAGADIVDVGGESTRPGAARVDTEEELARVLPVVRGLVARGVAVSIDTMNARTAAEAVAAGAEIINDVSGGLADPDMYRTVAASGATYIAMHWRGHSDGMDALATYDDVVAEVREELTSRIAELIVWGVHPRRIIVDPGLGFAKTAEHNWALLGRLPELETLGPVLVGASRKRFLGALLPEGAPASDRDRPTALVSALAAQAGAWGVRVHDVESTRSALDLWERWERGASS